jgi:hypothetical protein
VWVKQRTADRVLGQATGYPGRAGVSPAVAHFPARDEKKMLKKYVRSRNVYENKQISDTMPGKKSDIFVLDSDIYV